MHKKKPNPIDQHVGERIKARRLEQCMSLRTLGEQLGVKWQQVQKYEDAQNRISASKLYMVAETLNTPVEWFFEGMRN